MYSPFTNRKGRKNNPILRTHWQFPYWRNIKRPLCIGLRILETHLHNYFTLRFRKTPNFTFRDHYSYSSRLFKPSTVLYILKRAFFLSTRVPNQFITGVEPFRTNVFVAGTHANSVFWGKRVFILDPQRGFSKFPTSGLADTITGQIFVSHFWGRIGVSEIFGAY